jgi:hypothetical protein
MTAKTATASENRRRLAIAASLAILGGIALGLVLLGLAMCAYPGGTALDRTVPGHSFWGNFLCDLTGDVAVNGIANPLGASLARAAMIALAVALSCFWLVAPLSFADGWAYSRSIKAFGLLAVVGVLFLPLATGWGHVFVVLASAVAGLVASILVLIGSVRWSRSRLLASLACTSVTAGLWDAVLYAQSYMVEPRVVAPALPFLQRVALMLFLAWMIAVAVRVLTTPGRTRGRDSDESRR